MRVLTFGAGGLLAALFVGAMPIEARAVTPDQLFQKVFPKVNQTSERKPAKRKPHRAPRAVEPAKAATPAPVVDAPAASAAVSTPLPTPRPPVKAEAVEAPVVAATPLPRTKPAEDRKAAGLVAIPAPAEATVGTVKTVPVPADPALASGAIAAASALAGAVPADPPSEGELAFAPPVLPTLLKPTPTEGRNVDGSLKKGDRLPPPEKEAALAPADPAPTGKAEDDKSAVAEATPPSLPMPRRKPDVVLAALVPNIIPAVPEALAACRASMSGLKISASALPAIHAGSCGGPDPFEVTALEGGKVDLEPGAKINCAVATTLAR
ncbi:MAG TPA: hypothetical protein VGN75_09420, partial [Kaistia sp.]|nr:hypothetical protein [Kaistia sp.]